MPLWLANLSENFCWITCNNCSCRDVFDDHAAGADDGSGADGKSAEDGGIGSDGGTGFDPRWNDFPVILGLQGTGCVGCPGIFVIDEHDTVSDEDIVFDGNTFADKGVARDFAIFADCRAFLDFNEGTDFSVVTDTAALEVDEVVNLYFFA